MNSCNYNYPKLKTTNFRHCFSVTPHYNPVHTVPLYADSGATGIFLPTSFVQHINSDNKHIPISITQPDGTHLPSAASGNLPIPGLPISATDAHVFPDLKVGLVGLPQLCDNDLTVTLTKTDITITDPTGAVLINHPRTGSLWTLPYSMPLPESPPSKFGYPPGLARTRINPDLIHSAYNLFPIPTTSAGRCLYYQQCLGSPTKANMVKAAVDGHLTRSFPELTPAFIRKSYVVTEATAKAHLQRTRQHIHSSRVTPPPSSRPLEPTQLITNLLTPQEAYGTACVNYTDATAPFPKTNVHFLLTYADSPNYIKVSVIKNYTQAAFLKTYASHVDFFTTTNPSLSFSPTLAVFDNILHDDLRRYLQRKNIPVQLVPPGNHRANNAERAIQTFKKAFIACLATAHPDFPLDALEYLAPHLEFCLNILRKSRADPSVSAWEQLHGRYNHHRLPLIPFGAKGLVYEPSTTRALGTFGPHGSTGFYIGHAYDHFGSYRMYVTDTRATRVTDSIYWLPHNPSYPRYERLPINIFASAPIPADAILPSPQRPVNEGAPRDAPTAAPTTRDTPTDAPARVSPLPVLEGAPGPRDTPQLPVSEGVPVPYTRHTPTVPVNPRSSPAAPVSPASTPALFHSPSSNRLRRDPNLKHALAFYGHYEKSIRGPQFAEWQASMDRELNMLTTTFPDGISVVPDAAVPLAKRKCPFLNPVTREKTDSATGAVIDLRTRLTWGRQARPPDPSVNSSSVAASPVIKLLLNSAVSQPHFILSSIDVDYFYYTTRLTEPDYCRLHVRYIPAASRQRLGIAHLPDNATVYLRTTIAIPGRPDAGKLAHDALISHLAPHGYLECKHTPCLFYHVDRPTIRFPIHVDDILVLHDPRTTDFDHLCNVLRQKYTLKVKPVANAFLGIKIDLRRHPTDPSLDELRISIPGGVHKALARLNFRPSSNPGSPMIYTPPTYTSADQFESTDDSPPATAAQRQFLMEAVGYFRWYSPAVDPTLLPAVSHLSLQQVKPTRLTMAKLDRLLNFAHHHPNATIIYRPSNMQLHIHSDCSHHSEPNARSRTGIFMTCGKPIFNGLDKPSIVNGAIDVVSVILKYVTGSVSESEYGALYTAAVNACPHRQTLEDLGHPQNPCPITYDNEVAGKIARCTAKLKRSKAIAKCFHWIQDRIKHGEYVLHWGPGKLNLGDYFSKCHPVHHYKDMRRIYVSDIAHPITLD